MTLERRFSLQPCFVQTSMTLEGRSMAAAVLTRAADKVQSRPRLAASGEIGRCPAR
jgi:hypothetical protein